MKNFVPKRAISALIAGMMIAAPAAPMITRSVITVSAAKVLTTSPSHTQEVGWYNDYHHEIWQADTPNSSTMTLHDNDGGFSTSWKCGPNNSRGNFLARRGLYWGLNNPKTYKNYGNFYCDYDCSWYAGSSGNSRICIYGWAQNPLVEYYIIEDWKNWSPAQDGSAQYKGQTTIDGSVYKVYTTSRNSYTIEGNKNFTQYISIRQNLRTKGTISVSEHFKAWESMGMKMGNLYEVAFNVEGWESDGQADVSLKFREGESGGTGGTTGGTGSTTTVPNPDSNGDYFTSTFENGAGNWEGRGAASVAIDSKNYYGGSKSLYVSGRTSNWHGASIPLSTSTFVPGNSFSFSTGVLQKSGSSTSMKMTLQYTDSSGTEQYDEVASATAQNGKWTKLENTSYKIPSGASNLVLYVEAPDSLTDFYIDNVQASKAGKSSSVTTGGGKVDSSSSGTGTGSSDVITSDAGLKDVFSSRFSKIGTCISTRDLNNSDFVKKHFNSITPENDMKPENILDQSASQNYGNNVNPQVKLNSNLKTILDYAVKNNIPVRGHTLIWHSQTPSWFFKENFSNNGAQVSKQVMDQRMENFIKNTFAMIKQNYPTLKLYAYDVVNEAFDVSNGNLRSNSPYYSIYGDDSYMQNAFKYARKYAPSDCKLFYNDFNEYNDGKVTSIYNFCKKVHEAGYLDGIGMQSHLGTTYPSISKYKNALDLFSSISGIEIHVTELDVMQQGASDSSFASYYKDIVQSIVNCDAVTSLTWWGTNDGYSWRSSDTPLLFNSSFQPKQAYNSVVSIIPTSLWGQTNGNENQDDPYEYTNTGAYPTNIKANYNTQYHQVQFVWDKVQGADKYGIAVYLAGKWRVQTSNISTNSYVTPKNLTPGMSYKVAVAARVNGQWDTTNAIKNAINVTVR